MEDVLINRSVFGCPKVLFVYITRGHLSEEEGVMLSPKSIQITVYMYFMSPLSQFSRLGEREGGREEGRDPVTYSFVFACMY